MKASKLLQQGYQGYWCYAMDIQKKEKIAENIHVVCEFEDVFPKELSGLPPQRDFDF